MDHVLQENVSVLATLMDHLVQFVNLDLQDYNVTFQFVMEFLLLILQFVVEEDLVFLKMVNQFVNVKVDILVPLANLSCVTELID